MVDTPTRKGSIFSRRRSLEPVNDDPATNPNHPANTTARRGFFGGGRGSLDSGANHANGNGNLDRSGSVMSGTNSVRSGGGGFFGRDARNFDLHKDPTILAAREKVTHAENAEAEADRALLQARAMVREAKDHVRVLEREAAMECVPSISHDAFADSLCVLQG
jgi:hypothetical protein